MCPDLYKMLVKSVSKEPQLQRALETEILKFPHLPASQLSPSTKTPTTGTTQPSPQEPVTALEMKRGPGALSGRQSKCTGRCPQVASDQIFAIPKTPI